MPADLKPGATAGLSSSALPIINALWIGQLSPVEHLCLGSFAAQGHPVHLYAYDPIDNLPTGVTIQDAGEILPRELIFKNQLGKGKGSLAAFSDLFRFKLMLDRGGLWVDADIFCLKPFDFTAPYVFGFEGTSVASGVIKMPRGCDLAERCFGLASRVDPATGRKTFTVPDNSHAVHLYNEMWRRHHLDKHRLYPANSVLNVLRRHAGIETLDTELPPSILSLTTRRIAQTLFRRAA
jgi:hypothetical protein